MTQRPFRTVTSFSAATIERMRDAIQKMQEPLQGLPDGWSISPVDPNQVLALFPTLRLRNDRRLIAYQYVAGGNGNGFVLAWPKDAPVPEPPADQESDPFCMEPFIAHLHSYLAAGGWDAEEYLSKNIMWAIEGDGSARSYLEASFFDREIHEFGAMWHGTDWGTHRLVDEDPFTEGILVYSDTIRPPVLSSRSDDPFTEDIQVDSDDKGSRIRLEQEDWTWERKAPREWLPTVTMTERQSRVEFYTYSGLGCESLNLHRDTYTQGRYECRSTFRRIAWSPNGYRF